MNIRDYSIPHTIKEAYEGLLKNRNNTILGGGAFLRMGKKNIATAIDLSKLSLDQIIEKDEEIEIGAMVTLRQVETSPILEKYFSGVLKRSAENIVGVQLRNIVTVGGTVYSRYGFSDFLTALACLDVEVELYNKGRIDLHTFLEEGIDKDILTKIIIKKEDRKASFNDLRNSQSDYAILNTSVSYLEGTFKIIVGARPNRAKLAKKACEYLLKDNITKEDIHHAADLVAEELVFGSNTRASGEYRKNVCRALVKRGIMEVIK